eukprot:3583298-Pleurochrysis_carterae.AAC.5
MLDGAEPLAHHRQKSFAQQAIANCSNQIEQRKREGHGQQMQEQALSVIAQERVTMNARAPRCSPPCASMCVAECMAVTQKARQLACLDDGVDSASMPLPFCSVSPRPSGLPSSAAHHGLELHAHHSVDDVLNRARRHVDRNSACEHSPDEQS